jgi:hypothetical protein
VRIGLVGVVLAGAAIILISFGFNNLNGWGLGVARPGAPFSLLGLSPAPVMIVAGIVLGQAFLRWTARRERANETPLPLLEVLDSPRERAAVYAMFTVVALEAPLNFPVPLYIQIVQGRTPAELQAEVNLDSVTFVGNDQLAGVVAATSATPEQKAEALRINTEARLRALRIGLLIMAGLAVLSVLPMGRLPDYRPGEIPECGRGDPLTSGPWCLSGNF